MGLIESLIAENRQRLEAIATQIIRISIHYHFPFLWL